MKTGRPRKYKSWRMSRNIFYDEAYKYMLNRIEEIDENRKKIFSNSNKLKEVEKKLTIFYNMMNKYSNGEPDADGFLIDKYNLMVYGFKNIVERDINYWSDHSLESQQDLNLLMLEALINEEFNVNIICYTYIISHCKSLTEDFIDDLIYVTSDLFAFEDWDDAHVNKIVKAVCRKNIESPTSNKWLVKWYGINNLPRKITSKINFLHLKNFGNLSDEYIKDKQFYLDINNIREVKKYEKNNE